MARAAVKEPAATTTDQPPATGASADDWSLPPELEADIQRELNGEPPAAGVETPPQGETPPPAEVSPPADGEGDEVATFIRESLGTATPEAIATFLKTLPDDQREAALAEFKAQAKDEGRTEAEEALGTIRKQAEAQDAVLQTSAQAARAMAQTFGMYRQGANGQVQFVPGEVDRVFDAIAGELEDDEPDTDKLKRHLADLEELVSGEAVVQRLSLVTEGRRILGARSAGQDVAKAFGAYDTLFSGEQADLTDEERTRFNKARDDDFARGGHSRMGVMLEIIVGRARADERTKAREEALKQARSELGVLEKIEQLKGAGVPPRTPEGSRTAPGTSDELIARWNAGKMTRAEYMDHKRAGRIDDSF